MRRVYDVFEKFPDGSTLWRATVAGRFETKRKIFELAEHSDNDFFTIELEVEEMLRPTFTENMRPMANTTAAERR